MDITSFIPSQRQAILERFQQVEALGLGAVRIELRLRILLASSMSVTLWQRKIIFLIKQLVSFRILYVKGLGTHFFGCR